MGAPVMNNEDSEPLHLRAWNDLPSEILSAIADRLELIELLSFRGTCKDFRSASSTASAKIQSHRSPWLLFCKTDSSECLIFNDHQSKSYSRNIPDLEGATCLASYQGWLLLFKDGSIYFLCPFSMVKISLPGFPHSQIDGHVAAFSDEPTSPDCIVSVIDQISTTINIIWRGQTSWTQYQVPRASKLSSTITGATFDRKTETFYYMDDARYVTTFSVRDKQWKLYSIVKGGSKDSANRLPYFYLNDVFRERIDGKRWQLDLEEDEYVTVCGLSYEYVNEVPGLYLNEVAGVSAVKTRMRRAIWIQPRFFDAADTNQHW